jgi:hypothetical protein
MFPLTKTFCKVYIDSQYPNFKEVNFILGLGREKEFHLTLKALWLPDSLSRNPKNYYEKYYEGDYFQSDFFATPQRNGLGSLMHDFLIEYKNELGFPINNIYSTNVIEDNQEYTAAAKAFWEKRISLGRAENNYDANRYRILF